MPKKSKQTEKSSAPKAAGIYQLKITLREVKPPVWRRIQVKDCSLADLHYIIQACMGWTDSHLHAFDLNGLAYGDPELDDDGDVCDSHTMSLSQLVAEGLTQFTYGYDFGDDWQHVVKIEKVVAPEPNVKYPRCLDGKRACPPEDCGGAYGYVDFLETIRDPDHEEHDEMLEWVGGRFDPEAFDIAVVNRALKNAG